MVRETGMAHTLPNDLYASIMNTVRSELPLYSVTVEDCNAKSFVGFCRMMGGNIHIRVSSAYTGVEYFLTLTHEIAHAYTFCKYKTSPQKINPHGKEWKDEYRSFVSRFLGKGYFSPEIERGITVHMINPPFNAKLHTELLKAMNPGCIPLSELRCGSYMKISGGLLLVKVKQSYSKVVIRSTETGQLFTLHKDTFVFKV